MGARGKLALRALCLVCLFGVGLFATGTALPRGLQFVFPGFVTKSHSPATATAGADLTYSLAVANTDTNQSTVFGVTIQDALPPGLTAASVSPGCSGSTEVACSVGDLGPGPSSTYTIVVRPPVAGTYTNSAYATGDVCGDGCVETSATTSDVAAVRAPLTVSVAGEGSVTSSPAGIDCPSACSASFPDATSVTLSASPASGYAFAGWGGDCSGTGSCTVAMHESRSVSASFRATGSAPSITVQPDAEQLYQGQSTAFTAAASGDPAPSPQWQVSRDGGASFSDLPGATSTTLQFSAASAEDGNEYRAVFTNGNGSATTRAVRLTIKTSSGAPASTAPAAQTATTGGADLAATASFGGGAAVQGSSVTLTLVVTNAGPQAATGVVLRAQLGAGLAFRSASASQGSCTGAGPVACTVGDLAAGGSATATVTAQATATGLLGATASAGADQSDPDTSDNGASATVAVALPPAAAPPATPPPPPILPPPVPGSLVNAQPVSGNVLVDGRLFRSPAQVHVGSLIDTRGGTIELVTGSALTLFYGGRFRLEQGKAPNGITTLVLAPVVPRTVCAKTPASRRARRPQMALRPKVLALLWGRGKGRFRTRGRYSSATVRGTTWLTAERCDGTFSYVREGSVSLRDETRKKTIVLSAGHSYLARPPRR